VKCKGGETFLEPTGMTWTVSEHVELIHYSQIARSTMFLTMPWSDEDLIPERGYGNRNKAIATEKILTSLLESATG